MLLMRELFVVIVYFQNFLLVTAIVVEQNYYSYYKLPTEVNANNSTENFFLLQCPYRATMKIPLLQEMEMCTIIARYGAITPTFTSKGNLPLTIPGSTLHTRVYYRIHQPLGHKLAQMLNLVPKVVIKPVALTKQEVQNVDKSKLKRHVVSSILPLNMEYSISRKTRADQQDNKFPTTLSFLGAGEAALEELFRDKSSQHEEEEVAAKSKDESLRFFAEHSKFNKGDKIVGYQNMYHRDEIFNDHIFYDDLQQHGNYHNYGKDEQENT